jgi:uncharacterized YkwD family protein
VLNFSKQFLTLVLTTGLLMTGGAPVVRADGFQTPWFQGVNDAAPTGKGFDPLGLIEGYRSFWLYGEGVAWATYDRWRLAQQAPAIYAARSATPLPSLLARPATALVPAEKPHQAEAAPAPAATRAPAPAPAQPAPRPAAEPDQAVKSGAGEQVQVPSSPIPDEPLLPEAEPAPLPDQQAPAPEPDPAPTPEPDPAPTPEPAPAPAPDPQPAPAPAPAPAPPAQPAPASGLAADEQTMVSLVNAERTKAGLPALAVDTRLVQTARAKSGDMITHSYFSHQSPVFGSPFDQMRSSGIRYLAAGENIAGNQTVESAHEALMNSPGHRANILSTRFTKIGIGIVKGGPYGLMVTQQFIGE